MATRSSATGTANQVRPEDIFVVGVLATDRSTIETGMRRNFRERRKSETILGLEWFFGTSASNRVNPVLATKLKSGIDDDSQSVWEVTHIGPQEVWPLKGKFTVARKDSRVAIPGVIRSRIELEKQGISFLGPGSVAPSELPITPRGTTYNMAQEVTWLDNQHFAVGRWDGSLSIFSYIESATQGPLITTAVSDPGSEGVQMIALIAPWTFVTSCGGTRLSVWTATNNDWRTLQTQNIAYPNSWVRRTAPLLRQTKGHRCWQSVTRAAYSVPG